MSTRNYSCAVYISSGLTSIASRVAAAAAAIPNIAVVDTFTDEAYARSSVKLVADSESLLLGVEAAATTALGAIDLSEQLHPAPHPRQGAVDMISFMPLSEKSAGSIRSELDACDELAWRAGSRIGALGCPVLMYGPRAGRSLLETRRGTSFFASTKASAAREATADLPLDFFGTSGDGGDDGHMKNGLGSAGVLASLPQRTGVTIIGTQPYVTNFNIQIVNASLEECRAAAAAVRSRFGVQVMALPHAGGSHEVGCNLQASDTIDSPDQQEVLAVVAKALPSAATIQRSYVIGLTPAEAMAKALDADAC
jgi:glutamate formiminotransferase